MRASFHQLKILSPCLLAQSCWLKLLPPQLLQQLLLLPLLLPVP
jgi:hypothetical protein